MTSYACDTRDCSFYTWEACKQHMDKEAHWVWPFECYTDTCDSRFTTVEKAEEHMHLHNHFPYNKKCGKCGSLFRFTHERDRHQNHECAGPPPYCHDCDLYFCDNQALTQHLNSSIHKPNPFSCPFCGRGFSAASAVGQHVESSGCPNARHLNRTVIHSAISQRDPNGVITNRLLNWTSQSVVVSTWDSNAAWNGYYYECYLCHREFDYPDSLDQHISSPAHQQPLYHCPNTNGPCGGRSFTTAGGLFQHLEATVCGMTRFAQNQRKMLQRSLGRLGG